VIDRAILMFDISFCLSNWGQSTGTSLSSRSRAMSFSDAIKSAHKKTRLMTGQLPRTGVEPARLAALPPQSSASANSATWAS
jgi:hypothetical protein